MNGLLTKVATAKVANLGATQVPNLGVMEVKVSGAMVVKANGTMVVKEIGVLGAMMVKVIGVPRKGKGKGWRTGGDLHLHGGIGAKETGAKEIGEKEIGAKETGAKETGTMHGAQVKVRKAGVTHGVMGKEAGMIRGAREEAMGCPYQSSSAKISSL